MIFYVRNGIQYKVNDQWVLYSKYQDLGFTRTIKIKKPNREDYILHTYWTFKGMQFIEGILDRLGYKRQGEQLVLF
jgi:anti-repressor protein